MAEFQYTMKQWRRICDAHGRCSSCPLRGCVSDPDSRTDMEIATLEGTIMRWAEEHPEEQSEHVYPTWQEWFETFDEGIDVDEPIPADIAEKLGLKPKEDA